MRVWDNSKVFNDLIIMGLLVCCFCADMKNVLSIVI